MKSLECDPSDAIVESVRRGLKALQARSRPLQKIVSEYSSLSVINRELYVRNHQLEKEVLELREENGQLTTCNERLKRGPETAEEVSRLRMELGSLYKDKSKLLEDLFSARAEGAAEKSRADQKESELHVATSTIEELREIIKEEVDARLAAAREVAGALSIKEQTLEENENLKAENKRLMNKLVEIKEKEAERIMHISLMHEEAMAEAVKMKKEAQAELQAAELIRSKLKLNSPQSLTRQSLSESQGEPESRVSLKMVMGLGDRGLSSCERIMPSSPSRSALAHKGGAFALSASSFGNLFASCGVNQAINIWDVGNVHCLGNTGSAASPILTLFGHASMNDVAFNSDGQRILAGGSDRSILVWDSLGGVRHTMTGHSAAVTGLSCSVSDTSCVLSIGEDRVMKLWDINRGFCTRSFPCAKMPLNVVLCHDSSTAATGHSDGSISLWDVRAKDNVGPNDTKNHSMAICSLSRGSDGNILCCASRDNSISLVDLRGAGLGISQTLKCPGFNLGLVGGIGRQRCKVDMSPDGRYVAAGSSDGSIVVWDLSLPSNPPSTIKHHKESVVATAWNSDSSLLGSADKGGVVAFWSFVI